MVLGATAPSGERLVWALCGAGATVVGVDPRQPDAEEMAYALRTRGMKYRQCDDLEEVSSDLSRPDVVILCDGAPNVGDGTFGAAKGALRLDLRRCVRSADGMSQEALSAEPEGIGSPDGAVEIIEQMIMVCLRDTEEVLGEEPRRPPESLVRFAWSDLTSRRRAGA